MTYGKWNDSGGLDYTDTVGSNTLFSGDLNITFQVMIPLGGLVAFAKGLSGVPQTYPDSFVECDGSAISDADSPFDGQTLPDINSTQRFIRGATTSSTTSDVTTHNHTTGAANFQVSADNAAVVTMAAPSHHHNNVPTANNLPKYYTIVWLMRIK